MLWATKTTYGAEIVIARKLVFDSSENVRENIVFLASVYRFLENMEQ